MSSLLNKNFKKDNKTACKHQNKSQSYTSEIAYGYLSWQRLEKGIVTGCTISVALFVMGMNLIINAAKRETRGPMTASWIHLPSNRTFMDDLTISTTTHVQARWVLTALDDTVNWARMKFKPNKFRSLVIKK